MLFPYPQPMSHMQVKTLVQGNFQHHGLLPVTRLPYTSFVLDR